LPSYTGSADFRAIDLQMMLFYIFLTINISRIKRLAYLYDASNCEKYQMYRVTRTTNPNPHYAQKTWMGLSFIGEMLLLPFIKVHILLTGK
jgi:hypothetical protein